MGPDAEAVEQFRSHSRNGTLVQGGLKVCWDEDVAQARRTVHRLWANEGLPGELAQILPTPEHFEQASTLVTPDKIKMPHGPDPQPYLDTIEEFGKAGYDTLHISAVGPHYRELIDLYAREIIPHAGGRG